MEFMLALDLPNKLPGEESRARVRVKGKIIRSDPDGIAVRFESKYKITSLGLNRWNGMLP